MVNQRLNVSMFGLALLAGFSFATSTARGDDPNEHIPPPEKVDDSPSAYACTIETLQTEEHCLMEAAVQKSANPAQQAIENVRIAVSLGPRACNKPARLRGDKSADAEMFAICQREFAAAAQASCSLDGDFPLLDEAGRFAPQAKVCYDALSSVLVRTRTMTRLSAPCCRCLSKKCGFAAAQCYPEVVRGSFAQNTLACAATANCDACEAVVPATAIPREEPPVSPSKKRTSGASWY